MDIKLETYEGPLDLLHAQLKKNKTDIYNIDISTITDQFLAYIEALQHAETHTSTSAMHMQSMSEFILLAADLIAIKTKLLLNVETEDDTDPVKELAFRLEVYETFVNVAEKLREMQHHSVFYREESAETLAPSSVLALNSDAFVLHQAFANLLKRQQAVPEPVVPRITVEQETFTIQDKVLYLQSMLRNKRQLNFAQVIQSTPSISEKVVIFLALLELLADKQVQVKQTDTDITIIKTNQPEKE